MEASATCHCFDGGGEFSGSLPANVGPLFLASLREGSAPAWVCVRRGRTSSRRSCCANANPETKNEVNVRRATVFETAILRIKARSLATKSRGGAARQ